MRPLVLAQLLGGRLKYAYLGCQMMMLWLLLLFTLTAVSVRGVEFKYHNHRALEKTLRNFTEVYPELTSVYSIGKSIRGEWWAWLVLVVRVYGVSSGRG